MQKVMPNNRSINQSVNNPMHHASNQRSADNNSNQFTTLDPAQHQANLDYIQQIQSGVGNLQMSNEMEQMRINLDEPRDSSQQISTIRSSLNAPGQ